MFYNSVSLMFIRITIFLIAGLSAGAFSADLPSWNFDIPDDLNTWIPNSHLADTAIDNGVLQAHTIDSDPFLLCRTLNLDTSPWQYVLIRIKASRSGIGEIFWSSQLTGAHAGLTEAKKNRFHIRGGGQWQEIAVFPFWQTENKIRQLVQSQLSRLDLVNREEFDVQTKVLLRTREKLALLEQRINEIEIKFNVASVNIKQSDEKIDQ